jgi:ABC-type dipeptide/oligopeptide/nickel transport system permease component
MLWLAENLRIFNNAISGLVYQFKHNMHGPPTYLLGRVEKSFWYYFPVALTIKLSIPIFMIALTLLLLRAQALRNFAKAGAGALLAFSVLMRLQNGIRLVLPLVAFIIVGIAAAAATARRELGPGWKSQLLTCT